MKLNLKKALILNPNNNLARNILIRTQKYKAEIAAGKLRAKHILLETEIEAKEILVMLHNGTPFELLAREKSVDFHSAAKGGDLGLFSRGDFSPAFEEVVLKLKPGEISDILSTKHGHHIIKRIN